MNAPPLQVTTPWSYKYDPSLVTSDIPYATYVFHVLCLVCLMPRASYASLVSCIVPCMRLMPYASCFVPRMRLMPHASYASRVFMPHASYAPRVFYASHAPCVFIPHASLIDDCVSCSECFCSLIYIIFI